MSRPAYWGSEISKNPPSVEYDRMMLLDDSGVAELTEKIVGSPGLT